MTSTDVPDDVCHRPVTADVRPASTPFHLKRTCNTSFNQSLGNVTETLHCFSKAFLIVNQNLSVILWDVRELLSLQCFAK